MKDKINFNFTYFALKTLGNNLYSNPWVAISELVANGLDAGATDVKVLIDMRNKNSATIEIIDNGVGMSYDDLVDKYTIIGRNRREDDPNEKALGRKGVGKLATLYLTQHFYISTKTANEHTTWEVNTAKYKDSDVPGLEKVTNADVEYLADSDWRANSTGTVLKLVNVNLKSIGEERIKSLKAILADYYLYDKYSDAIKVAVLYDEIKEITFERIKKSIFFDTFYAMFDNTGNYLHQMKETVYITGEDDTYAEIDYPRQTRKYSEKDYIVKGQIKMQNISREFVDVNYQLNGWIGVNCSLKEDIQRRNSPNYKKLQYRGNELKLYVRGKLAVSDLMKYIGSVHAISNYIEGELSFDVLDRNDLEDIATSSREGYKADDPRVQKLIEILKPIVNKLISDRAAIGNQINEQQEKLRKAKDLEIENAKKSREEIEKALSVISNEKKEIERQNALANKRLFVLERNFIGDGENYKNGMHLAVNYAKAIKSKAIRLSQNASKGAQIHLVDIACYSENIIRLNKMLGKAKFSLNSPEIVENLFSFIKDYLATVSTSSLRCEFDFKVAEHVIEFDFCELSMALENILSNSKKAKASTLQIKSYQKDGKKYLEFADNGRGLDPEIKNIDDIFDLGVTTTKGYGIGCYQIKNVFNKLANSFETQGSKGLKYILELK